MYRKAFAVLALLVGMAPGQAAPEERDAQGQSREARGRPALSVTAVQPRGRALPLLLSANGSIAAWQEAVIGSEAANLRLAEVHAQVGDVIKRGQLLALFRGQTVAAELAQARASLAEAQATWAEAVETAGRARSVAGTGVLSEQQSTQYLTAERTALARRDLARAQVSSQALRLAQTRVLASDDGVISSRSATPGAVVGAGQELFRLIRKSRLEWRAEVTSAELSRLRAGLGARISAAGVGTVGGVVRVVAPTVDTVTRNALVYVDIPEALKHGFRAGMFARGEFALGSSEGLTLPQDAIVMQDGFNFVFRLGPGSGEMRRVARIKVVPGRRQDQWVEVRSGIRAEEQFVASGAAFLADGDLVRVAR